MKYFLLIIPILLFSCNKVSRQEKIADKEYTYNYHSDTVKTDDILSFYDNKEYQLENYLEPIMKEEFIKDSISYKNEYNLSNDLLKNNSFLKLPYGNVKLEKNLKRNSDSYIDYFYIGYSKTLNNHIINISLYEGSQTLLLYNIKYEYKVIDSEPIFSKNKTKIVTYIDNEGLSSYLTLYNIESKSLKLNKLLWSEKNIIDYSIWNKNNEVIVKLRNIENGKIGYYKVLLNDKNSSLKTFLNEKLKGNFSICIDKESDNSIKSVSCYEFKIDNDKAIVDANSLTCKGEYSINIIQENEIVLSSIDDSNCKFSIKYENQSYFIKKENTFNWKPLDKEN